MWRVNCVLRACRQEVWWWLGREADGVGRGWRGGVDGGVDGDVVVGVYREVHVLD